MRIVDDFLLEGGGGLQSFLELDVQEIDLLEGILFDHIDLSLLLDQLQVKPA